MKAYQTVLGLLALTLAGTATAYADALAPIAQTDDAAEVVLKTEAQNVGLTEFIAPGYKPGVIRHMVFFKYNPNVTEAQKDEVKARFLNLQKVATRNGHRYIVSIETGGQISGEGVDQGLEQGFIVTLRSEGDRNFYVGAPIIDTSTPEAREQNAEDFDAHHQAFKDFVGPFLAGVVVFDMKVEQKTGRNMY